MVLKVILICIFNISLIIFNLQKQKCQLSHEKIDRIAWEEFKRMDRKKYYKDSCLNIDFFYYINKKGHPKYKGFIDYCKNSKKFSQSDSIIEKFVKNFKDKPIILKHLKCVYNKFGKNKNKRVLMLRINKITITERIEKYRKK